MSCPESAGISSVVFFFALYLFIYRPKIKNRILFQWGLLIASGIQIIWADSKITYLTIFLSLVINFSVLMKIRFFRKLQIIISGAFLFTFIFWLSNAYTEYKMPVYGGPTRKMLLTITEAYKYAINGNPKVLLYNDIVSDAHDNGMKQLFGSGPGNLSSRFALINPTEMSGKYLLPLYERAQKITNSIMFNPTTLFLALLGDIGIIGLLCYYLLITCFYVNVAKNFIKEQYESNYDRMLAFSYCLFSSYFVLHSLIDDFGYIGIQQAFVWVVGASLYKKGTPKLYCADVDIDNKIQVAS
jgi:hypothetical protein